MFCLKGHKNLFELRRRSNYRDRIKGSYLREFVREFSQCQKISSNKGEVRIIVSQIMES